MISLMIIPSIFCFYAVFHGFTSTLKIFRGMRVGRLELPRALCPTDFKSGASTDSAILAINQPSSGFQVIGWRLQYSLKVIFISLSVNPAFLAAFGIFHFATNNISIDCRVSGLIIVASQDFFVKWWFVEIHKKVIGQKFWGIFLPPFLELKVDFPSDWRRIRKCVLIKHSTAQFQHTHELVHGFTIKNLLVTLLRVQIELTLYGVHDAACEVVVLHGVSLLTYVL